MPNLMVSYLSLNFFVQFRQRAQSKFKQMQNSESQNASSKVTESVFKEKKEKGFLLRIVVGYLMVYGRFLSISSARTAPIMTITIIAAIPKYATSLPIGVKL